MPCICLLIVKNSSISLFSETPYKTGKKKGILSMQWLEMHNMEYGECVVMGGKQSILMVDCGTVNQYIREGETPPEQYLEQICRRYSGLSQHHFLLSHFHRDHLNGFAYLLKKHPDYFNRVYLPCSPADSTGALPLIDFALFARLFLPPQNGCAQINTTSLRAFDLIGDMAGLEHITVLGAGDVIEWDGCEYEVLWPPREGHEFPPLFSMVTEQLNVMLSIPYYTGCEKQFLSYKDEFCRMYRQCCENLSPGNRAGEEKCRRDAARLHELLEVMHGLRDELNRSPTAPDIRELLEQPSTREAYSEAVNGASVVFHNLRTGSAGVNDILMTGDATPDVFDQLRDQLYDGYYIVKAPHHGTASGYSPVLAELAISHLLISNGEYHAGGQISRDYLEWPCVRHCTNPSVCKWYQTADCCCNRLACCYEQPSGGGLTIKCPAAMGLSRDAGCGVYLIGPGGERGCLCDL